MLRFIWSLGEIKSSGIKRIYNGSLKASANVAH